MCEIMDKIDKIQELCRELEGVDRSFFSEPIKEEDINKWEEDNDVIIPKQYKEWLMFSGKCDILGTVASFYMPRKSETIPEGFYVIGDLMGDGEKLCISDDGHRIVSFNHGEEEEYSMFSDVLDMIIEILELERITDE